jgi:hypothetical protein
MKNLCRCFVLLLIGVLPKISRAQFDHLKDSVVQLYGIVMTTDSLKALPGTTVSVKGTIRATETDEKGMFYIIAVKGDVIEFSYVGFKTEEVRVPSNIEGNQYSVIKTMSADTEYLPVTIIHARPSRSQFERDFVNTSLKDNQTEIARKNNDHESIKNLSAGLSTDAGEATSYHLNKEVQAYYYSGQVPSMNIFDVPSWKKFIQAWKRGDYKK